MNTPNENSFLSRILSQANEILSLDEASYLAFFQHAPVAMAVIDPGPMRILAANEMCLKLFGYAHEEFIGKSPFELTYPGDIVITKDNFRPFMSDSTGNVIVEKRYVRKDGSIFWAQAGLSILKREGENGELLIRTIVDITELRNAQGMLQQKVHELERLMDVVPAAVFVAHDRDCRLITGNELANRLLEASPNENISSTAFPEARRILSPEGKALNPDEMPMQIAAATNREVRDSEFIVENSLGQRTYLQGNASPLRTDSGECRGSIGAFQDVTERKKAEEIKRAQAIERARREAMESIHNLQVASLTAGMFAHEVNQPLSAIAFYTDALLLMAESRDVDPGTMRAVIEQCKDQALRAGNTIRELIKILYVGDVPSESFDLGREVAGVVDIVRAEDSLPARYRLSLEDDLPPVWAKRVHVQQVLLNLLHNSIEAMKEAKVPAPEVVILVGLEKNSGTAQVTVKDNGPGIDRKESGQLFSRFYTSKENGIGVGLPISRLLMEVNGGRLWADDASDGGATFHFTLPFSS